MFYEIGRKISAIKKFEICCCCYGFCDSSHAQNYGIGKIRNCTTRPLYVDIVKYSLFIFVPTFEENGIFMLGVVFFIQSIFGNQNNSF